MRVTNPTFVLSWTTAVLLAVSTIQAQPPTSDLKLHSFDRQNLSDTYYSEGVAHGDINGDGHQDVVYGPLWYAGPDFQTSHEIYPAKAQNRQGYANHFFAWVYDFNGDRRPDVLTVGFPGKPSYVYENPGPDGWGQPWSKHEVVDSVSNESPQFVDINGDKRPDLVCSRKGYFGYATFHPDQPFDTWQFHAVSEKVAPQPFGHGLGIGDINGDGRADLLIKNGWFEQPESNGGVWPFHEAAFARAGGAEMLVDDVDGDGDADVITSLAAHEFGLAWHEQLNDDGKIVFRQHLIMGDKPEQNEFGVVFSELHSVALADMDGDGLQDIVTGKTYWSHHTKSPLWDAGAVVYWFRLTRTADGVRWIPYRADEEAGIGRQMVVGDLNGDQLPDLMSGGMKGCHVMLHACETVDEAAWKAAQPRPHQALKSGLEPEQAARNMTVPAGFQVQLAAGEPQVHQPIAMAIDARGRVWVAEAYTYPIRAAEGRGRDRIIILADTTGDGRLDNRRIFAEGLNLVSGLEVGFGGVWVGAAPYLMFIPDRDGDDQPDGDPEILLDGFGYHDTHETLNAFTWGPDGWLYGCQGVFTHSRVGKPGTADEERVPLNACVWRYHPLRRQFEVFAWGTSNPWGVDFNDRGDAFITACVIPHLYHVIQGARYQRQAGRHFSDYIYDDIQTIADHAHYTGSIRDHAWWGSEPTLPAGTSQAGGGHAHCGAMIYLGDNWPESYRNQIFMNNIHGNRVNQDLLEAKGSGYVGHHGPDFLLANDAWYRGINLRYGPDGTVYLIDWYDPNACHRTNPEIWDRSNGRVFNVFHGTPRRVQVDLNQQTDGELVELHAHANAWYPRTARRILQHRSASRAIDDSAVEQLVAYTTHTDTTIVLRAMWTLHAMNAVDEPLTRRWLAHEDPAVRRWAITFMSESPAGMTDQADVLLERARHDASPRVRLAIASVLQKFPTTGPSADARWDIALALMNHPEDADDHNLPLMYWYAVEPLVAQNPRRALELAVATPLRQTGRLIARRAAAAPDLLGSVVDQLATAENAEQHQWLLEEMLRSFEGRVKLQAPEAWGPAFAVLNDSPSPRVRELADQAAVLFGDRRIFPKLRARMLDQGQPIRQRREALQILVRAQDRDAIDALLELLGDPQLKGDALRALAAYQDDRIAPRILASYRQLSAEQKRDAIQTLVSRPPAALALLAAIDLGQVPRTDVHAYDIRQLARFEDPSLQQRILDVWGNIRETSADKKARITELKQVLTAARLQAAESSNGRRLFDKTCGSCHKLFGAGGQVGPDLTGSNRANLDYLLENVLDPSAVLGKDYRMILLQLIDGRVVSGLIQNETDSAVTIRTINDTVVIPKDDIDDRRLSELSMMPEKLLDPLSSEEVCDLVAYLASPTQVALKGDPAPIDGKTGVVDGALEGESLAIVEKTAGQARSQDMGAFRKDRWSGAEHLWWTGAKPGDRLALELEVAASGTFTLEAVMTRARDYGIVQLSLNGKQLGSPIDLYNNPDVVTTGVITFDDLDLKAGKHRLGLEIVGAHPAAVQSYMVGVDYLRLVRQPAVE